MELELILKGHCIETAAKRRYEQIVAALLERDDEKLERELEFLLDFLKHADFSDLRKKGFDGSREMRVRVKKKDKEFIVKEI